MKNISIELDLAETNRQSAEKIAKNHNCDLTKWNDKGPSGHPVATFVCPDENTADQLVTAYYGTHRDSLDTYRVKQAA